MKLNFALLGIDKKQVGTVGTVGTANVYEGSRVPSLFPLPKPVGTEKQEAPCFVPTVPTAQNEWEQETANVYAAVPTVPTVPTQKQGWGIFAEEPDAPPAQEHTFWSEDFGRWALAHCLFHDRAFAGVKALHGHFCDWCIAQSTVGCLLGTFQALLADEGFLLGGGLVAGLILREDWEASQGGSPVAPEVSAESPLPSKPVRRGDLLCSA